jgi:GH15 family glucan-1,4-alpha-glucosidase
MGQLIEDYAYIGDLHTGALVGSDGSIDWLCLPRFDSPACFASLLGGKEQGSWRVAPAGADRCKERRYQRDSLVLETDWHTPEGVVRVIDFMPRRGEAADIVRIVEGVAGRVRMTSELRLRFDYGNVVPWVKHTEGQMAAIAGPDAVWLKTKVPLYGRDWATWGDFEVASGTRVPFVLTYNESHQGTPAGADPFEALSDTQAFWASWIAGCAYVGRWAREVRQSLVLLKGLTYAPSGGIVAAATTSLPESIRGIRNWDYRYCWLRDATYTLDALVGAGYIAEAKAWREWLLRAVAGDPGKLQIMYGIHGERRLPEYELPWLQGYEGSRPVRIGNGAANQFQLDVWGSVLGGLGLSREAGLAPSDDAWALQRALMNHLESRWEQPDSGIWEVRGPSRRFVHSQVMAWAGADHMIKAVERYRLEAPVERWRRTRADIHRTVCERGYNRARNTFTQSLDGVELDASLLLIGQVGFLPWHDERVIGTVDAVQRELAENGLLLRYRTEDSTDGIVGAEGAFLACSFWLAHALYRIGRIKAATGLFQRLLALRNDVGILAEEYDTSNLRQLGNTPQAFSHLALVSTAQAMSTG